MQNKQFVPSIKVDPLNPGIQLEDGPFYLERELHSWCRPVAGTGEDRKEYPRRALIDSFGAGGSNVALIIEEYPENVARNASAHQLVNPEVFVFSAKNESQLSLVVQRMAEFINNEVDVTLSDLAYTLQVGREEMSVRLAIVASNRNLLTQGLESYLEAVTAGREVRSPVPVFVGDLAASSTILTLMSGKSGEVIVQTLLEEKNLEKLAMLWVQGCSVPWTYLHTTRRKRLRLPTYPFDKKRHWLTIGPEASLECESKQRVVSTIEGKHHSAPIRPRSELEKKIVGIWENVLGRSEISIEDGFLTLGGNSLLAGHVASRIRDMFAVDVPIIVFLESRCTVAKLSVEVVYALAKQKNIADFDSLAKLMAEADPSNAQRSDLARHNR